MGGWLGESHATYHAICTVLYPCQNPRLVDSFDLELPCQTTADQSQIADLENGCHNARDNDTKAYSNVNDHRIPRNSTRQLNVHVAINALSYAAGSPFQMP